MPSAAVPSVFEPSNGSAGSPGFARRARKITGNATRDDLLLEISACLDREIPNIHAKLDRIMKAMGIDDG